MFARFVNEPGPFEGGPVVAEFVHQQFGVTDDGGEEVIEIVGDAASEPAHGFELVRVAELFLGLVQRVFRAAKFQN